MSRMKKVHDYFFPHARNGYKPNFFSVRSLSVFALGLLVLQGAYFAHTKVVFEKTDFLAAVLPGALVNLTNNDRAEASLSALERDLELERAAQLAVNDMAAKGYFSHVSPDGKNPWYWLGQVGYNYSYSGQNLAVNFTDSKDVENAWMNSPTHRANIMKGEYTHVGIAVAKGVYNGKDATFVVQYFATPRSGAVPTPALEPTITTPSEVEGGGEIARTNRRSQVAGEEITVPVEVTAPAASIPETPAEVIAQVPETISNTAITVNEAVHEPAGFLATLATSPHYTLMFLLTFMTAAIMVILAIAIAKHLRVQYVEVLGGGAALMAVSLMFLIGNALMNPTVTLPSDSGGSMVDTLSFAR